MESHLSDNQMELGGHTETGPTRPHSNVTLNFKLF